ncbi:MAG: type 4a pilus biogenesis protein PilO [Candidatus Taylorbacteria bacterium]|nr:type 4a pilus biogenesis protein PilO [Candidatus Taylorbacteria bacterium]
MSNIVSIILVIASFGLFFGYIDPTYSSVSAPDATEKELSIKELLSKKADYDRALTNSREYQEEKERLLKKFNEMPRSNLEKLEKLLPNNIDNVRLVIDVDEMAKSYGMRIRNFRAEPGGDGDTIGRDSTAYGTLTLSFSTTAPYNTFLAFLRDLEQSLRIIDVTGIQFASSNQSDLYDYNVSVKTYWLK